MGKIKVSEFFSPCGTLVLGAFQGSLCLCDWEHGRRSGYTRERLSRALKAEYDCIGPVHEDFRCCGEDGETLLKTAEELEEYFSGQRKSFDVPFKLYGTAFQVKVWETLLRIPYGQIRSYKEVAASIGISAAVRAVANANAANPVSIIVPCHRVIGSDGTLTGYGGGLEAKKYLLCLERQN